MRAIEGEVSALLLKMDSRYITNSLNVYMFCDLSFLLCAKRMYRHRIPTTTVKKYGFSLVIKKVNPGVTGLHPSSLIF